MAHEAPQFAEVPPHAPLPQVEPKEPWSLVALSPAGQISEGLREVDRVWPREQRELTCLQLEPCSQLQLVLPDLWRQLSELQGRDDISQSRPHARFHTNCRTSLHL